MRAPAWGEVPAHAWSQRFGGTGRDVGQAIAVDGVGNVLVTGRFFGTVDFGGGPLVSAGGTEIFVAKYDAGGAHVWSQRFGGSSNDQGVSIAVDGAGNALVTGGFSGTVDFGGGPLVSSGISDIFVAKYDAGGAHVWSQRFGGTSGDVGSAIAVDGAGNALVTGAFSGTADFGGGPLVSAGISDIFVAKYDAGGAHVWSQRFGDTSTDQGFAIAVDGAGNALVTGRFSGIVDFGGGPLTSTGTNIFVAKYDTGGAHVWSQSFGDFFSDQGLAIAVDGAGNALVTGSFVGKVNFGGGPLVSAGDLEIFVAKYDAGGAHVWSQRFGSTSQDVGQAIAVDGAGNVLVSGRFFGTVDFGGGPLTGAGTDIFVAKYDASGTHVWSRRFGDLIGDDDEGLAIAVDGAGNALVTGSFDGTVDFGGGPLASAGISDIFVAKYVDPPRIASITDIANDQGRQVRVSFQKSPLDAPAAGPLVSQYEVYRRMDTLPNPVSIGPGSTDDRIATARTAGMRSDVAILSQGWDFIVALPAHGQNEYSLVSPTLADSTITDGQHWSVFFVRGATDDQFVFFDSPPDSGFSLDNLSPAAPTNLAFTAPGLLAWDEAPEADFNFFTVYGSASTVFDATAVTLGATTLSGFDVQAASFQHFHVTATDFSGNEGDASSVSDAPTPALLLGFRSDWVGDHVEVSWRLINIVGELAFSVSRRGGPSGLYHRIPDPEIIGASGEFRFEDHATEPGKTYGYRVVISEDGRVVASFEVMAMTPSLLLALKQNHPNPFNPLTQIPFVIEQPGQVSLRIYDISGRLVRKLVDRPMQAGTHTEVWDARDDRGHRVASGVYFYRLLAGTRTLARKAVLLK